MVRYDKETARRGAKYVEDRRGSGTSRRVGTGSGMPVGKVGGGIGALLVLVIGLLLGGNVLDGGSSGTSTSTGIDIGVPGFGAGTDSGAVDGGTASGAAVPAVDQTKEFMQFLMVDIQDTWSEYFQQNGLQYTPTSMVIFTGSVDTGCGRATSAVGPFYCGAPGDNKVYIDLDFYNELATRFGAPGDFAQAYVIAHEIGHHIQQISGISDQVRQAQQSDPSLQNPLSVRQELQADCFAGVWAHSAAGRTTADGLPIIEAGDIAEGLAAAQSVGDDRIQSQAGMQINPETWTHGSAAAREAWFREGYTTGDPNQCDTYAASDSQVGL
jgi:predicted metalloprotease